MLFAVCVSTVHFCMHATCVRTQAQRSRALVLLVHRAPRELASLLTTEFYTANVTMGHRLDVLKVSHNENRVRQGRAEALVVVWTQLSLTCSHAELMTNTVTGDRASSGEHVVSDDGEQQDHWPFERRQRWRWRRRWWWSWSSGTYAHININFQTHCSSSSRPRRRRR
jgi:hypothetical protein